MKLSNPIYNNNISFLIYLEFEIVIFQRNIENIAPSYSIN